MKHVIQLVSRDGTDNKLIRVAKRSYELKTPYCYRGGKTEAGKNFIDPSGGPMMVEGEYLPEADAYIESINRGIIIFKEDK